MSSIVLVIAAGCGMVAVVALLVAHEATRTADRMQSARLVTCVGVAGCTGPVRVHGVAEPLPAPGGAPVAPLSGTPYAWCEASVTETEYYHDSDGDRQSRTRVVARLEGRPFLVRDAGGAVLVRTDQLSWHDLPKSVDARSRELPPGLRQDRVGTASEWLMGVGLNERWAGTAARMLASGDGGNYELTEQVVPAGTPVLVVGEAVRQPDGSVALAGKVLASTETPEEVRTDQRRSARTAVIVAVVAAVVGAATLLAGALL